MLKKLSLISTLLILLLSSCDDARNYTLKELEANLYNDLELRVEPALDADQYKELFKQFKAMNQEQILGKLSEQGLELHQASFGLYYLANTYAADKDFENTIRYHKIAAEQYINPQSLLKLAEINFHVNKDYAKAYKYLHQSLEVTVEITENNRSHPLAKNGKDKAQFLLQELELSGNKGAFDKAAIREALKASLPALLEQYRKMYGLGPRVESSL